MKSLNIKIGNAQLAGERAGTGNPLVFLHAGVADKRMWQPQIAAFNKDHQTIAYDRRGFGKTTTPDEAFSNVEDLQAVLDQLDIESTALIGCSQGGRVAIDFALANPKRVNALVLISPAISGAPAPQTFSPEIEKLVDALDEAEEADDLARINEIEAHLWLDGPAGAAGRVGGELRELFLDMNGIALGMPELTKEIEPASAYECVSGLSLPTLVLWGDLDFPHVKERCKYLVETISGAQGKEIPGTAHLPNLEQPEKVNSLLRTFLTKAAH